MTTSGPALILDSWALLEIALNGQRRDEVDELFGRAGRRFTVRDVLFECNNFLMRRTRPAIAREWWQVMRESDVTILEPPLDEIDLMLSRIDRSSGLSAVDVSVAWAARHARVKEVATNDRGFEALGLTPLFA